MPEIATEYGQIVLRDGLVGLAPDCCCGSAGPQPCDIQLCCDILAIFNSINYILDPSAGSGVECDAEGNPVRGWSDAIVTDGTCPGGGGACTFTVRIYWTATFTLRNAGLNSPCYQVADPVFDDLVLTAVNCPGCEANIADVAFFGQDENGC